MGLDLKNNTTATSIKGGEPPAHPLNKTLSRLAEQTDIVLNIVLFNKPHRRTIILNTPLAGFSSSLFTSSSRSMQVRSQRWWESFTNIRNSRRLTILNSYRNKMEINYTSIIVKINGATIQTVKKNGYKVVQISKPLFF